MNGALIIAGLTIKEASRRRALWASAIVALLFGLFAFMPLNLSHNNPMLGMEGIRDYTSKVMAWLGCGMIKFFSSVLAVTLAAGAISAEAERGVLSVVLPKPISRLSVYIGKWIGLLAIVLGSAAFWAVLLALAIHKQTDIFHPLMFRGVAATCLFPILFVTMTLFFSSFSGFALSAGLALILAGTSLAQDILHGLSQMFTSATLQTLSVFAGNLVPLGRMNHWISLGLGDAGLDPNTMRAGFDRSVNADVIVTHGDMVYVIAYIAVFLAAGIWIFQKRDV